MAKTVELAVGKIQKYNPDERVYTVSMSDGRILRGCRKVGDITTNVGGRKVGELDVDVNVLVALMWCEDFGVDAPEGFILGGFETYRGGKLGTTVDKETMPVGTQGFIDKHKRRILLHPDGTIEMRSGAWCQFVMDPEDNSITGIFQNMQLTKDKSNFFKWIIHPKSEDLKDSIVHLCMSGVNSLSKSEPDIELLAGALYDLKSDEYFHSDKFEVDPQAKVAIRISNPDGDIRTDYFEQIGAMGDGSVKKVKILHGDNVEFSIDIGNLDSGEILKVAAKRTGGVDAEIGIGDMDDLAGRVRINNVGIDVLSDGGYKIFNDGTEIEGTNNGVVNLVCSKSNLGKKDAKNKIAVAEEVVNILKQLFAAIKVSFYQATAPGAPTKPGPLNQPQFDAVEQQLDKIKSKYHTING